MTARAGFGKAQQSRRSKGGSAAEAAVEACNAACKIAGVAELWRHATPTRIVGPGRTSIFSAKATVDYSGIMLDGTGRAVAVEVKRLSTKTLRLPLSRIEPHQRAHLATVHASGGVAVVLVVHAARLYAVPWGVVAEHKVSVPGDVVARYAAGPVYLRAWARMQAKGA